MFLGVNVLYLNYHLQMVPWRYWPRESRAAVKTIQKWKFSVAGERELQGGLHTMCEVSVYVCACVWGWCVCGL